MQGREAAQEPLFLMALVTSLDFVVNVYSGREGAATPFKVGQYRKRCA